MSQPDVFVTGATGFVGAHVLHELLAKHDGTIYCLVRALADAAVGLHRIERILAQRGLWSETYATRIVAVPGNLTLPRFGVDAGTYPTLVERVRTVIHLAGRVNWVQNYEALEGVNTLAVREACALSEDAGAQMAFLSTLGVFPNLSRANLDDSLLDPSDKLLNGYAESKRAAERLLIAPRERGVRVTVFRTANITGDSKGGPAPTNQSFILFVRSCLRVGTVPDGDVFFYDVLPVDYVASLIVAVTSHGDLSGRNYNVVSRNRDVNREGVRRFLCDRSGLRSVPYVEWRRQVLADAESPLGPLRDFLLPEEGPIANGCAAANLRHAEAVLGLSEPAVTPAFLERSLAGISGRE
jgi:thioester reductase-like protein